MTRVIAASPVVTLRVIERGDDVTVVVGHHVGETGTVICSFRGWLTIGRANGLAFLVKATECKIKEATPARDSL